jgi:hypothetical protein
MKVIGLITFLLFTVPGFAQNDTKLLLVDEFEQVTCDDFLARIDYFYSRLNNSPASNGYFVITGSNEFLRRKLSIELLFESAVEFRKFERARTEIIRGQETGPLLVKLWMAGAGIKKPDFGETKWNLRLAPRSSPFLMRSDMAQICDPPPVKQIARELLDANQDGSIFVIVHGPTSSKRKTELRLARRMMMSIKSHRVRYLLRHSQSSYSDYYFSVGNPKRSDFESYF